MKFTEFLAEKTKLDEALPLSSVAKEFQTQINSAKPAQLKALMTDIQTAFKQKKLTASEFDELSAELGAKMDKYNIHEAQTINQVDPDVVRSISARIPELLHKANQINIFHWVTTEHKVHMALGELYEDMREDIDELAEAWIAIGGPLTAYEPFKFEITGDIGTINKYLEECLESVTNCIEATNTPELMTVNSIAIDIQGDIQKAMYLIR